MHEEKNGANRAAAVMTNDALARVAPSLIESAAAGNAGVATAIAPSFRPFWLLSAARTALPRETKTGAGIGVILLASIATPF